MSNTQLAQLLVNQPPQIRDEIIRINTDSRPLALQVALLIPILAGLIGLFNSFRMMRLPDPAPSGSGEGMASADVSTGRTAHSVRVMTLDLRSGTLLEWMRPGQ